MLSFYDILFHINGILYQLTAADSKVRAVQRVGFRPFVCWECRFESHWVHECLSLMNIVCCQVQVSASSWSPFQRSPIECGVSECDREASTLKTPWPIRGCRYMGGKISTREVYTHTHTHTHTNTTHTHTHTHTNTHIFPGWPTHCQPFSLRIVCFPLKQLQLWGYK